MPAAALFKPYPILDSVIAALLDWMRNRRSKLRLDGCDSYEVARMAREVGLTPRELVRMSKLGPDAAKLLPQRMTALHLDPVALAKNDPSTMRDLQRLCSSCASKKQCRRDVIGYRDNPMWRQYCPNSGTLEALQRDAVDFRCSAKRERFTYGRTQSISQSSRNDRKLPGAAVTVAL